MVTAVAGPGKVDLTWTAAAANGAPVTGYNIYRGASSGGEGAVPVATLSSVLTWTDSPLAAGTYYYVVRAVNTAGPGAASNEASGVATVVLPPGAPALNVFGGQGSASLTWSAPSNNGGSAITGYNVYRGTGPGGEGAIPVATLGNVLSWQDTPLAPGTYWYVVRAVNSAGPGSPSTEGSAVVTPAATPPDAPTLTGTSQYVIVGNAIKFVASLSWSVPAANGAPITSYRIYRGTTSTNAALFATVSGGITTYLDNSASTFATRFYEVSAVNGAGEGPRSNQISANQGG